MCLHTLETLNETSDTGFLCGFIFFPCSNSIRLIHQLVLVLFRNGVKFSQSIISDQDDSSTELIYNLF